MTGTPGRSAPLLGPDGRTVVVAMDHGLARGQVDGLTRPREVLQRAAGGGPDGFILPRGMGRVAAEAVPDVPWLLTADFYATSTLPAVSGEDEVHALLWGADDARALGAAGLKVLLVFGRVGPERFERDLGALARLISRAHELHLPVMVETVLWGPHVPDGGEDEAQAVVNAARTGFEIGADVLKIAIPRDPGPLRELCSGLPVPVVLMGGPVGDASALFERIHGALDAGARGVALGRNVWCHARPQAYVSALRALVHDRAPVAEALARLDP